MLAAVDAVGVGPFLDGFLAVKEDQVEVVHAWMALNRGCEFEKKAGGGSAIVCADKLIEPFGVEVAGDRDGLAGFAGELRDDVFHLDGARGGLRRELVGGDFGSTGGQLLFDPSPELCVFRGARRPGAEGDRPCCVAHRGFPVKVMALGLGGELAAKGQTAQDRGNRIGLQ